MTQRNRQSNRVTEAGLKPLIEPLAGYICAVDDPKAALVWALLTLFDEVGQINAAAKAHIAALAENDL